MGKFDSTYNSADNYKFDMSDIQAKQKQQDEKRKLRRVYSTDLINELIDERNRGYDIPYDAFFMKDLELRAPGVTFRMTPEEMEIYQKCYDDALYYVDNYCQFMTDKGRKTVELRDFQKKMIKTVTDETYIPEIDDFGPKNRNIIWMAARQTGKCLTINQLVNIKDVLTGDSSNNISFFDIYYKDAVLTFFEKIKMFLYRLYKKL